MASAHPHPKGKGGRGSEESGNPEPPLWSLGGQECDLGGWEWRGGAGEACHALPFTDPAVMGPEAGTDCGASGLPSEPTCGVRAPRQLNTFVVIWGWSLCAAVSAAGPESSEELGGGPREGCSCPPHPELLLAPLP